jgi:hypothetical protein
MVVIAIISIWIMLMLFFISYEPCGNASDNVALALTVGLAVGGAVGGGILGNIGRIGAKIGVAIASTIVAMMYEASAVTGLSSDCKNVEAGGI